MNCVQGEGGCHVWQGTIGREAASERARQGQQRGEKERKKTANEGRDRRAPEGGEKITRGNYEIMSLIDQRIHLALKLLTREGSICLEREAHGPKL